MSAQPVILPDLGASPHALTISAWFVEVDDTVEPGDRVAEVLMSGITCDVAAPAGGTVTSIEKPVGQIVKPGDILAWITPAT